MFSENPTSTMLTRASWPGAMDMTLRPLPPLFMCLLLSRSSVTSRSRSSSSSSFLVRRAKRCATKSLIFILGLLRSGVGERVVEGETTGEVEAGVRAEAGVRTEKSSRDFILALWLYRLLLALELRVWKLGDTERWDPISLRSVSGSCWLPL